MNFVADRQKLAPLYPIVASEVGVVGFVYPHRMNADDSTWKSDSDPSN